VDGGAADAYCGHAGTGCAGSLGRHHEQPVAAGARSQVDLATTIPAPAIRQRTRRRRSRSPFGLIAPPDHRELLASPDMSFGRGFTMVAVILGVVHPPARGLRCPRSAPEPS